MIREADRLYTTHLTTLENDDGIDRRYRKW
jgi:hypothetical protein